MHLSLIGFMGSGKSTVGAYLADRQGALLWIQTRRLSACWGFRKDIFDKLGEPAFREAEQDTLSGPCVRAPIVLATGGGTPCAEAPWNGCAEDRWWWPSASFGSLAGTVERWSVSTSAP